ncbi:hypothetical protein [Nocardia takedensis]|uniref:hypothetical protein n=1 Tax=Nocardia takedensis TaxID=259390 RepID=UPI001576FA62|nr:hypothetical protein [Nocardia takedensis]
MAALPVLRGSASVAALLLPVSVLRTSSVSVSTLSVSVSTLSVSVSTLSVSVSTLSVSVSTLSLSVSVSTQALSVSVSTLSVSVSVSTQALSVSSSVAVWVVASVWVVPAVASAAAKPSRPRLVQDSGRVRLRDRSAHRCLRHRVPKAESAGRTWPRWGCPRSRADRSREPHSRVWRARR